MYRTLCILRTLLYKLFLISNTTEETQRQSMQANTALRWWRGEDPYVLDRTAWNSNNIVRWTIEHCNRTYPANTTPEYYYNGLLKCRVCAEYSELSESTIRRTKTWKEYRKTGETK